MSVLCVCVCKCLCVFAWSRLTPATLLTSMTSCWLRLKYKATSTKSTVRLRELVKLCLSVTSLTETSSVACVLTWCQTFCEWCVIGRDLILGNNRTGLYSNVAMLQRCLHGIKWWLYGCRMYTVYVTVLQLYNHCLTTPALNVNTCSTRLERTARLTQMQHKTWWLLVCLNSFAQAAVIENTWLYLLCLLVSSAGLMLPTPSEN